MSASLANLAHWAASLEAEQVPADVLQLARVQHVAAAGTVRAARATAGGQACVARAEAGAAHSALLAYTNLDDYLLAARAGLGAVPAAWAGAAGTLAEWLAHTVVANEVAGRVGLALALRHRPDRVDHRGPAVASAVVRARLAGASPAGMLRAIAGAVTTVDGSDVPAAAGVDGACALARAVHTTPDREGDDLAQLAGEGPVLASALGALGSRWLTRTLTVKRWPSTPWGEVAIEGVNVILERHLRAAEKRLRTDQVDRIEIRTAFGPPATEAAASSIDGAASAAWSIVGAVGLLVAHHELTPALLEPGASGDKEPDMREMLARVAVLHDWRLSVREARATAGALGPVLGEAGVRAVVASAQKLLIGRPPAAELLPILRERPWEVPGSLRRGGGLDDVDVDGYAHHFPVEVKLYTTRGGWWPERRSRPVGQGAGARAVAAARYGAGAEALMDGPLAAPAADFVRAVLA